MNKEEFHDSQAITYACYSDKTLYHQQFIEEHTLTYQISGETHIEVPYRTIVLKAGQVLLSKRNQLIKAFQYPKDGQDYQAISIHLHQQRLEKYAVDYQFDCKSHHSTHPHIQVEASKLIATCFKALLPCPADFYGSGSVEEENKIYEILGLLLENNLGYENLLFDFSEPTKIDLKEFMLKHYLFNVPIKNFAKLTGRSLASFKRDFQKIFKTSPRKWLKDKRLDEAYYLMDRRNKKPSEIYLEVGFENLSHFYSSFKAKFGITPSKLA